MKGHIKF